MLVFERIFRDVESVAFDEQLSALVAVCVVARVPWNVAYVDVAQPLIMRNFHGYLESLDWRWLAVCHLVLRIEAAEMRRCGWPKLLNAPLAKLSDFLGIIIFSRYHEVGGLKVYAVFDHPFASLEDRLHATRHPAYLFIEAVAERFDVDVCRVKIRADLLPSIQAHVPVRHVDVVEALLVCELCSVVAELEPYCGFDVCVGDALAVVALRQLDHALGSDFIASNGFDVCLRDGPVLAVAARKVAADGAYGEGSAPWPEVVERLFLDRVCGHRCDDSINLGV